MKRTQFSLSTLIVSASAAALAIVLMVFLYRHYFSGHWKEHFARYDNQNQTDRIPRDIQPPEPRTYEEHQSFRGLDLTKVPSTTRYANIPDLFEARPPGSQSFHLRNNVVVVESGIDGSLFYLPEKDQFNVQSDPLGSSSLTYFVPIHGQP